MAMTGQKEIKKLAATLKKQLKERPELFAPLADCYLQLDRAKDAERLLMQGLTKLPHSVEGWLVQGNLHLQREEHRKAREAFEEALKLNNDIPYAHEQSAELAAAMSDLEGQERHLTELQRLAPLDDNVQSVLNTMVLRRLAVEKGLYSREEVERVIPGVLRQTLSEHNLIPAELERRSDRPYMRFRTTDLDEDLVIVETTPGTDEPVAPTPDAGGIHLDTPPAIKPGKPAESFETLKQTTEQAATRFQPDGLDVRTTRVNWAETTAPERGTPVVETSAFAPGWESAAPAATPTEPLTTPAQPLGVASQGGGTENAAVGADFGATPRESPIMRLLRGEMRERPVSREVKFFEEEPAAAPHQPPKPPTLESAKDLIAPPEPPTPPLKPVAEVAKPVELKVEPVAPPPPVVKPVVAAMPVTLESPKIAPPPSAAPTPAVQKELAEVARQVTGVPPAPKPPEPTAKPSGERIATKTLAELYASQGDWKRAVEVYEQLLKKHPTNVAYQQRLNELKNKMEAGKKG
jgi:tetratricopeptide (TPR) repeat protein